MNVLRTVAGDIPSDQIGHLQPHEHVLCDLAGTECQQGTVLGSTDEIRLDNYYETRRHHSTFDLVLDDIDVAVAELTTYARQGGCAVVDATSIGIGRDPEGLLEVSRRSGVHIVMGCGYYHKDYHKGIPGMPLARRSRELIAEEIYRDLTEGVGNHAIKSGVIGEIGLGWPVSPVERRVLQAACDAARWAGAGLLIHPGRHPAAPLDAMRIVDEAGGDASRAIMCHIDRTLFDVAAMRALARTGCYLEFDLFGQESSYYPLADIDMPNDATRVDHLATLIDHDLGKRLLIAQDICSKTHLQTYGGEGYGHILRNVIPLMRRKGFDDSTIADLTVHNPVAAVELRQVGRRDSVPPPSPQPASPTVDRDQEARSHA